MNELQRKYIMEPEGDNCFIHNDLSDELIQCEVSGLHHQIMFCITHITVCQGIAQAIITPEALAEKMKRKSDIAKIRKAFADLMDRKILIQDENGIGFNFKFSEWNKKKKKKKR